MKALLVGLSLVLSIGASASEFLPDCRNRNGEILKTDVSQLRSIMGNRRANKPQVYVAGIISEIKSEDHSGLPHQKFFIKVDKDIELQIVSNLDFGRIPLVVGKKISVCGEFLRVGDGMVHWTHFDPHGSHPDGFSIIDGQLYGEHEVPVK
ncbi:hypothetical protein C0V70_14060 [Bacteriovorax stolpii]|uniref:Uncharacterized protein n=1 Tax=Bacteriovorax stolpii TaxID=960 RepID=A0A2K9NUQ1_BACTC|nr:DUF3465 domain-containing protein [Bacteriovorax stolpii]AUN99207.1 hypothetical protein C0V70_14060 [Bacteriovorax stolpii]TDP55255.1 uncharacterized protein DUF3465 [Bacteriovorax stolpii]